MAVQTQFSPKIIGAGKPGCKTQDLMKFAGLIEQLDVKQGGEKLTLSLPKSSAITPESCRKFEKEAGCNEKDTPTSAKEKMMNCKSGEFEGAIEESFRFHYQQHMCQIYATRSDDFGATGVLTTSFVQVNTNQKDAFNISNIRSSAIEVLSSAFSDEAKTMARMFAKWGSEGTGILVNPYYADELEMGYDSVKTGPVFSLAYLAPLKKSDYSTWQVSRGIAATPVECSNLKKVFSTNETWTLELVLGTAHLYQPVGLEGKGWLPTPTFFKPTFARSPDPKTIAKVSGMLNTAMEWIRKGAPLYAELVCEGSDKLYDWIVLQMSGLEWSNFSRPRTNFNNGSIRSERVMGFADKKTAGVQFAKSQPDTEMEKYNSTHNGYLLVIETSDLKNFEKHWRLQHYGNAGAIVFVAGDIFNPVPSHVGGLLRMLDIPIIVFDKSRDYVKVNDLQALSKDANLRVVVDETAPIGGLTKI